MQIPLIKADLQNSLNSKKTFYNIKKNRYLVSNKFANYQPEELMIKRKTWPFRTRFYFKWSIHYEE
ncbi:hypothetical protein Pcaca03_01520 [Pectobacterium carotovorum subsp. carotovorum]|uniref:Uncharacterized protein n=1 Tax=Pectobacterium carotovorum subsp. carotovorum TaxID=555 RepID=A0AAI9KX38_PECCC|nr:hypothetical protein SOASR016_01520 [Pectobacterium carotovorum subsp. carotovorum]GLV67708.1 hypothetical protein Pcaca03_01520 [Pectobacterium carotovorum subsp. carotovorum]